jgi:hypothetical protein
MLNTTYCRIRLAWMAVIKMFEGSSSRSSLLKKSAFTQEKDSGMGNDPKYIENGRSMKKIGVYVFSA